MNILFTIRNISCSGGTERVCIRLANALADRGHTIHIVDYDSKKHTPFYNCDKRIRIWTILNHGGFERKMRCFFWYGALKLRRYIKKHNIEVVIDVDTFNALWTASAIRGLGIRWISWDHFNINYCKGERRCKALQLVRDEANALVLLSKTDKQNYLLHTDIPEEKIYHIYNPLSFEIDHPINHEGQKKVLAMGRISKQKGFDLLLESWKIVEMQMPDWSLEIVCGYGDFMALEQEARTMGLNNVYCTGPTNDVPSKMASAAIFALPSRFEGFGLVITEAAVSSVPTVSYDCPCGPNEIITDGEDGFLVEPNNIEQFANKLLDLMHNDKLRTEMGIKAYKSSKRFALTEIIKQWEQLIKN